MDMTAISAMVIDDDGCTFTPTDEELVGYYLYNKIVGIQDRMTLYVELPVVDPYSQQPCAIWQQCGGIDDQDLYFFTKLNKKKSRVTRKVALGGTWCGESKAHTLFSSSLHCEGASEFITIGSFKRFHYENNNPDYKGSGGDDYSWIMYEYTLNPTCIPVGIVHDSFVLCKIRRRQISKKKNTNIAHYDYSAAVSTTLFASDNGHTTTTVMEQGREEKEQYIDNPDPKRRKLAQQEEKEKEKEEQGLADNLSCIDNMAFTEEEMNELLYSNSSDYQHPQIPTTQMEFWNQSPPHLQQPPNQCPTTLQMEPKDQNADDLFIEELEKDLEQYSTFWSDFEI